MSTTSDTTLSRRLQSLAQRLAEQAWADPKAKNSAFLQDHAYSLSEFSQQAEREELADGDSMTAAQQRRIARLLASGHVTNIALTYSSFDLPANWITVTVTYGGDRVIYGGIDPEGNMST